MTNVVYLTGATGYIGKAIVDQCELCDSISKIYCPIRSKKESTGQDRFQVQFGNCLKAAFIEPSAKIPEDVNLVILNAYSLPFFDPIDKILRENVELMIHLLEQCHDLKSLKGVSIVSTAYVQQPLPFKRHAENHIPFIFKEQGWSPSHVYKNILNGSNEFDALLPYYYQLNRYAYSKHIMESVVQEKFPGLPICFVRPSIVMHTRDGKRGHDVNNGFLLLLKSCHKPFLRFIPQKGIADLVFLEDVVVDIIQGAEHVAAPAKELDGAWFHPVILSTSGAAIANRTTHLEMYHMSAPQIKRFDVRSKKLRSVLRTGESTLIRLNAGKRAAKLVKTVYKSYDFFWSNSWDFEVAHPFTKDELRDSIKRFREQEALLKEGSAAERTAPPTLLKKGGESSLARIGHKSRLFIRSLSSGMTARESSSDNRPESDNEQDAKLVCDPPMTATSSGPK